MTVAACDRPPSHARISKAQSRISRCDTRGSGVPPPGQPLNPQLAGPPSPAEFGDFPANGASRPGQAP